MKSNKELAKITTLKIEQLKKEKKQIQRKLAALVSVATSFAIIIGLSALFPNLVKTDSIFTDYGDQIASIFIANSIGSYLVIGLISFVLGVIVTLLCKKSFDSKEEKADD